MSEWYEIIDDINRIKTHTARIISLGDKMMYYRNAIARIQSAHKDNTNPILNIDVYGNDTLGTAGHTHVGIEHNLNVLDDEDKALSSAVSELVLSYCAKKIALLYEQIQKERDLII